MAEISVLAVANSAEILDGNLYALGMGWTWGRTPTPPMSIVAGIIIPPSRLAAGDVPSAVVLEDADGRELWSATWVTPANIEVSLPESGGVDVDRTMWAVFSVAPMPLVPGRYQFRAMCDDAVRTYAFAVIA